MVVGKIDRRLQGLRREVRVESQIIPGIAVDAANQKFGPCQRRRAGRLGVDRYIAKILASTYVIALSQPSGTGLQLRINSGVTVQRDFQYSADSIRPTQLREECLHCTQAFRFVR
jgi:hypothetical protein